MDTDKNEGSANALSGNAKELKRMISDNQALICKTDYGYKVISLVPDVKKIYLEVTTRCNFDCTTCIRNSWDDELGHMDVKVFSALVNQLKELPDLHTVHFGGFGEPLSHPSIFEMIKSIKELGLKVEMITNGSLLTKDTINKLIDLQLDNLFVSLDGPDEEIYNDIRKGADFVSVVTNIKAFNRIKSERGTAKPDLGIEFVVMKSNYHKLPLMGKLVDELKARQLLVTNVLPYCKELKDEIVYDLDDTVPLFNSSLLIIRAHMPNMKIRTERYCNFIENKALAVTWEGNVAPCYALMHTYKCYIYGREKKMFPYHIANLNTKPLNEIWTDPGYARFRATVKDFNFPSCTDCKHLDGCTYPDDNREDCWANSPSCAECLWARRMILCP